MKMDQGLINSQETQLKMSHNLQLSLKVLQFSSQELADYLRIEMEKNPLLEMLDDKSKVIEQQDKEQYPMDWKEYFRDTALNQRGLDDPLYREDDIEETIMDQSVTTLYEHLMLQLDVIDIAQDDRRVAAFIIKHLDTNGYLPISKNEIASTLNMDRERVSKVLKLVQTFDPPGVGARSLRECLLIQLKQKGQLTQDLKTIVLEHLKDIAANHYALISKKVHLSIGEVQEMCDIIKALEPKPGRPFSGNCTLRCLIPDVEVIKQNDGYQVEVQDVSAPRFKISKAYQQMLSNPQSESEVTQFLNERLQSAHWILRAIEQRRQTIKKVVEAIVYYQQEFLENGILYLRPLTLKMIAEHTHFHESTVSRAIHGKYIQTARGLFELKSLFDTGYTTPAGKAISSQAIKKMIVNIIEKENVLKPYSDQGLSVVLLNQGLEVSRRTIAKYREEMGIASAAKRKRFEK